ncbi:Uncharacterized protein {ECO:0000313/EMBL:ERM12980.1} [Pantoea ananatis]|nr:hypothetical protein L585_16915 [Pantoea ananatis BRT175]PKC40903.1 hypothetical protein V461_21250 [Pantoea ananatis BRT98]REC93191.1 hypothetical protein C7423_101587 [Pantoea ananatis]REF12354.1 hypothetical protein C7428_1613 [Pantoea ananatis]CRH38646.1 Uncharacterized protein {ECO:0000313/EMBL:ERM12980.1} [Pantoea ananatis]
MVLIFIMTSIFMAITRHLTARLKEIKNLFIYPPARINFMPGLLTVMSPSQEVQK